MARFCAWTILPLFGSQAWIARGLISQRFDIQVQKDYHHGQLVAALRKALGKVHDMEPTFAALTHELASLESMQNMLAISNSSRIDPAMLKFSNETVGKLEKQSHNLQELLSHFGWKTARHSST